MALDRAPDGLIASSVAVSRVRFVLGLVLVTIGAGAFAVAFRAALVAVYQTFYRADNIGDSIASLPRWLRLTVPVATAAVAGSIARLRSSRMQGVSNVMEAIALGRVQLSLRATASRVASSRVASQVVLSIGREGPLIEVGGAWVRRWVEPSRGEKGFGAPGRDRHDHPNGTLVNAVGSLTTSGLRAWRYRR